MSCNCGKCYVGRTKRPFRIRIDEHEKNFNLKEKFHNVISKHRKNYEDDQINHFFHWNDVKFYIKKQIFLKDPFLKWFI